MNGASIDHFHERLQSLDTGLFEHIGPPGWRGDSASLLALHAACRDAHDAFAYLEIGSYLGSSLQSFVADDRCTSIVSIDPRPETVPDDLRGMSHYAENTTEHMLARLGGVSGADLEKVRTFEADSADVDPAELPEVPRLCFIDGEHTHRAALSDAHFCRDAMRGEGAVVFHDRPIVATAISEFLEELERDRLPYMAYALPWVLFVVELGPRRLGDAEVVRRRIPAIWLVANRAPRRSRALRTLLVSEARARRAGRRVKNVVTAARESRRAPATDASKWRK